MTNKRLKPLMERLGHTFKDETLLENALTHRSVAGQKSNERLEFLGDSIVNFIIASEVYARFAKASEGELTRLRAKLVNGRMLGSVAQELDVPDYLLLGEGEKRTGGTQRPSISADALEALIAAIYLDAGLEVARTCVLGWFDSRLENLSMKDLKKDPKTQLQEWMQSRQNTLPSYTLVDTQGPAHARTFEVRCEADGLPPAVGTGSSRRAAEQMAAEILLGELRDRKS